MEFNKATRSDLLNIDPRSIKVIEGFNPRQDYGDIESLSASIAENGVKNPLSGYKKVVDGVDVYYLTDGHRRLKATLMAIENGSEILRVPFKLESKTYTDVERLCDTVIKNDGKNLTQYELAFVFNKLVESYGWSTSEVAKKFGKQQSFICNTIQLLTLPNEVQKQISNGLISPNTAVTIVRNSKDENEAVKNVTETVKTAQENGKKKATNKDIKVKDFIAKNDTEIVKKALKSIIVNMCSIEVEDLTKEGEKFFEVITDFRQELLLGKTIEETIIKFFKK